MDILLEVDARNMSCPLPILKAKKGLATLQSGQIMKILSTDKASRDDFQAFAFQTGHKILDVSEDNGVYTHILQKK